MKYRDVGKSTKDFWIVFDEVEIYIVQHLVRVISSDSRKNPFHFWICKGIM